MNKNSLVDIKNKFDLKGYVILEKIFSKLKVKLIKKNLFHYLNKNQKKFNKKKTFPFILNKTWPIDIDYPDDLIVASSLMKKKKN